MSFMSLELVEADKEIGNYLIIKNKNQPYRYGLEFTVLRFFKNIRVYCRSLIWISGWRSILKSLWSFEYSFTTIYHASICTIFVLKRFFDSPMWPERGKKLRNMKTLINYSIVYLLLSNKLLLEERKSLQKLRGRHQVDKNKWHIMVGKGEWTQTLNFFLVPKCLCTGSNAPFGATQNVGLVKFPFLTLSLVFNWFFYLITTRSLLPKEYESSPHSHQSYWADAFSSARSVHVHMILGPLVLPSNFLFLWVPQPSY